MLPTEGREYLEGLEVRGGGEEVGESNRGGEGRGSGRVTGVEWGEEFWESDRGGMEWGGERRRVRVKGIDWGGEVGG